MQKTIKWFSSQSVLILLMLCGCFYTAQGQQTDSIKVAEQKNNILKINVAALVFKNISIQYERKVGKKTTVAINGRMIPVGDIPFKSSFKDAIDVASVNFDLFKIGLTGITGEFRWYVGKKGAFRGFYLGPFISYNHYTSEVPVNYMNDAKTGIFKGNTSSLTAGLQFGAQWRLSNHLYLDWWILGPNYGSTKGELVLVTPLNDMEQLSMQFELEKIRIATPIDIVESYKVTASGATATIKGQWAGIRAMGFGLGYRF
jgi:hypothetical protein